MRQKRLRDAQKIIAYKALTNEVLTSKHEGRLTIKELELTERLLKLNPEFNAAWNYRRDLIVALKSQLPLDFWEKELSFTTEQLKAFPKVYWIWNHRFWCLDEYPGSPIKIWQRELAIVNKLLSMDARNFHCWQYRRIIVARLEEMTLTSLNQQELDYTTAKINENISNFSAWHQRANLLPKMFQSGQIADRKGFVNQELAYISNAIFTDAEDQSVWYYVKWFIKSDCVIKELSTEEYKSLLQRLKDGIIMINEDEAEFSGKENTWCLKILCYLEAIQMDELHIDMQSKRSEYLSKLAMIDPLRKNRYRYLQSSQEGK